MGNHLSSTILGRIFYYFSLASIPVIALAVYLAIDEGRQADATALAEEQRATQLVGQDVGLVFQLTRGTIQNIIKRHSTEEVCSELRGNSEELPSIFNIAVLEVTPGQTASRPVCSALPMEEIRKVSLSADEARLTAMALAAGEVRMAPVRPSLKDGSPVIPVFGTFQKEADGKRLIVAASLNLTWLNNRVNAVPVPNEAVLLVLDANGVVVARNPPSPAWPIGTPAPEFERTLASHADFAGEIRGKDDINRFYTIRRVSGTDGLVVVMKRRSSVVFADSRRHLAVQMAAIVLIFGFSFVMVWKNSRKYVAAPLKQLGAAADCIGAHDFTARTGLEYRGEIGTLARHFDSMAEEIQRNDAEKGELIRGLGESERRFREHLETMELLAIMVDERGVITFCNEALLKLLGFARHEMVGRRAIEFVVEEDREHSRYPARTNVENRVMTRSGGRVFIRWNNTFLRSSSGVFEGVCGVGVDITEHRALLEQRLQSDRLESVGRLAAGVAHDFNNLLTVINGYSELVLTEVPEASSLRKPLMEVRKAGEQATALTRQLLTFSRAQVSEPKPFDLNAVVVESESMFSQLLGGKAELETSLEPGIGEVLADKAQFQQVLMNLMTNAMHAMPEGGKIVLETKLAAHPAGEPGEWVLLTLRDTGIGMTEETLSHIFDPFYTTRKDGKGTGLGLSIVYGIVRQNKGYLEVESVPGQGTTFRIWWKLGQSQRESVAVTPRQTVGPETILVVEDRDEVRNLMTVVLEKSGYKVLSAGDAEEAIRVAAGNRGRIDLLLSDVVMPGMDGRELAARLANADPEMRVVFMSGFAPEVISSGNTGYAFIQKPMTSEALIGKVREVLDGRFVGV